MIADSSPVDGFKGSLGVVGVKLAAFAGFFRWFAQGLAVEREAVRGVHEAVEDGIGDCGIDDHLVPMIDGELTGHDGRAAAVAVVDDFVQVAALLGGQRCPSTNSLSPATCVCRIVGARRLLHSP